MARRLLYLPEFSILIECDTCQGIFSFGWSATKKVCPGAYRSSVSGCRPGLHVLVKDFRSMNVGG